MGVCLFLPCHCTFFTRCCSFPSCLHMYVILWCCGMMHTAHRPIHRQINEYVIAGQYWRLVTPAFLHASLAHLMVMGCAHMEWLVLGCLQGPSWRLSLQHAHMPGCHVFVRACRSKQLRLARASFVLLSMLWACSSKPLHIFFK